MLGKRRVELVQKCAFPEIRRDEDELGAQFGFAFDHSKVFSRTGRSSYSEQHIRSAQASATVLLQPAASLDRGIDV